MRAVEPRGRQLRRRYPLGQRRAAGPPAPPARPQPVHRWWPNPTPSRNQAPRRRSHRSDVDAALGCHQLRSSATPPVASVTPNLLLLEIRRAFAAYSLPSRSPSSLGRRACSLACRPRPAVVPPPCDAAPTTAGRLLGSVCAAHKGWSGAGSNRRPSAFQGLAFPQVTPPTQDWRAIRCDISASPRSTVEASPHRHARPARTAPRISQHHGHRPHASTGMTRPGKRARDGASDP